jgi:hypothetical protein
MPQDLLISDYPDSSGSHIQTETPAMSFRTIASTPCYLSSMSFTNLSSCAGIVFNHARKQRNAQNGIVSSQMISPLQHHRWDGDGIRTFKTWRLQLVPKKGFLSGFLHVRKHCFLLV